MFVPLIETEFVTLVQTITGTRLVVVSRTNPDGVVAGQAMSSCVLFVGWIESTGGERDVTVTTTESVLFAGEASATLDDADAVFVMLPEPLAVTVMLTAAPLPMASVPMLAVMLPPELVTVPCDVIAETKVIPTGKTSATLTLVADALPKFVTASV